MTDRFSGKSFTDPQSDNIRKEVKARKFAKKDGEKESKDKERKKEGNGRAREII